MSNDEVPFREAGKVAGLAYNTIKQMRCRGALPFPVYERTLIPGKRPKLYCLVSDIEAWKKKATIMVPSGR